PALNGQGGLHLVRDTDGGRYDGDPVYDHAVGPMQFIPGTWQTYQVDADGDGVADPNDINDATLAAANYLCAGGRDLATSGGWWGAVLSYNAIQQYAQKVFDAANDYGQRARTIA
ncbi:MAG: lytic transglycosylase domain-containing protein, partial [Actinobacteria bacterium]